MYVILIDHNKWEQMHMTLLSIKIKHFLKDWVTKKKNKDLTYMNKG